MEARIQCFFVSPERLDQSKGRRLNALVGTTNAATNISEAAYIFFVGAVFSRHALFINNIEV